MSLQHLHITRCTPRRKRRRWPCLPLWLCNVIAFLVVAAAIAAVAGLPKLLAP